MLIPTLEALGKLGGSGSIDEIDEKVYEITGYDENILEILHDKNGVKTEVQYRLGWARSYLKIYGLLENASRSVWNLVDSKVDTSKLNPDEIVRFVKEAHQKKKSGTTKNLNFQNEEIEHKIEQQNKWKENLISAIVKITPDAFERLCQRLLRESGFIQVEITGRTGDGG